VIDIFDDEKTCELEASTFEQVRFFISDLSFLICHWKVEVVSQANKLDEDSIDGRTDRRKPTSLSNPEFISKNSQRKTED